MSMEKHTIRFTVTPEAQREYLRRTGEAVAREHFWKPLTLVHIQQALDLGATVDENGYLYLYAGELDFIPESTDQVLTAVRTAARKGGSGKGSPAERVSSQKFNEPDELVDWVLEELGAGPRRSKVGWQKSGGRPSPGSED